MRPGRRQEAAADESHTCLTLGSASEVPESADVLCAVQAERVAQAAARRQAEAAEAAKAEQAAKEARRREVAAEEARQQAAREAERKAQAAKREQEEQQRYVLEQQLCVELGRDSAATENSIDCRLSKIILR